MDSEIDSISKLALVNKIDPLEFDVTIGALLIGIGAEKYVDIFRKHNIGQTTLSELTDEDLIKLGVDSSEIRQKLLEEVKNFPIYQESNAKLIKASLNLSPIEIANILEESSQHLYRLYLSMIANLLAVKKTKKISDCLVHKDKYASDIALTTLSEITNILNGMDITLHKEFKEFTRETNNMKTKKIIVGTLGSVVIATLAVLFVRSLKDLK